MGFTFYTTVWPKGHVLHKQLLYYGIGSRILSLRYYILLIEGRGGEGGGGGGGGETVFSVSCVMWASLKHQL